jgi:hypothetical protein
VRPSPRNPGRLTNKERARDGSTSSARARRRSLGGILALLGRNLVV